MIRLGFALLLLIPVVVALGIALTHKPMLLRGQGYTPPGLDRTGVAEPTHAAAARDESDARSISNSDMSSPNSVLTATVEEDASDDVTIRQLRDYLPMHIGTSTNYSATYSSWLGSGKARVTMEHKELVEIEGRAFICVQVTTNRQGDSSEAEFFYRWEPDGLYLTTPDALRECARVFPSQLRSGYQWTTPMFDGVLNGQIMGVQQLVTANETYGDCVWIRTSKKSMTTDRWFARGIGLVRQIQSTNLATTAMDRVPSETSD